MMIFIAMPPSQVFEVEGGAPGATLIESISISPMAGSLAISRWLWSTFAEGLITRHQLLVMVYKAGRQRAAGLERPVHGLQLLFIELTSAHAAEYSVVLIHELLLYCWVHVHSMRALKQGSPRNSGF